MSFVFLSGPSYASTMCIFFQMDVKTLIRNVVLVVQCNDKGFEMNFKERAELQSDQTIGSFVKRIHEEMHLENRGVHMRNVQVFLHGIPLDPSERLCNFHLVDGSVLELSIKYGTSNPLDYHR
jgi:hypothetical protein